MKKNKDFYLLICLSTITIVTSIIGFVSKWIFNLSFFIGLISIIICFIVFYKFKKYSKKVFGIALILGTFSIILFTPFQMGFSIGIIKIQIISLLFLTAFAFINRTRIIDLIQNSSNKTQEEMYRPKIG
ncbi:hypothetical protein [Flavobacterium sp.]|uniref:hypothetical protein n=1 Tax=Flavobacterium sp. TaxID=239 RepID=UPI0037538A9B